MYTFWKLVNRLACKVGWFRLHVFAYKRRTRAAAKLLAKLVGAKQSRINRAESF